MPDADLWMEDASAQTGLDLGVVLRMLLRRRWLIAIVTSVAVVPVVLYPLSLPDLYSATVALELRATPEVAELGPKITVDRVGSRRRDPMGPLVALTTSGLVLGRVVDAFPPPSPSEPGLRERLGLGGAAAPLTADQLREARIRGLARRLGFGDEGDGTVLTISTEGYDPEGVAGLVNAVADALVAYHREERAAESRGVVSWLTTQIYDLRETIDRQVEAQNDLVERTRIRPPGTEPEPEIGGTQSLAEMRTQLREATLSLRAVEQRIAALAPFVQPTDPPSGRALGEVVALRRDYDSAVVELARARQAFTEAHPDVRRLAEKVRMLADELGPDLYLTLPDPTPEQIAEYGMLSSERARTRLRIRSLSASAEDLADPGGVRSAALDQYTARQREIEINRQMLSVLLERRSTTLLRSASEVENIRVRDYAVAPAFPSGPRRTRLWLLGGVVAVMLGVGAGVARELLEQSVREPNDVRKLLGLPVLGLVPTYEHGPSGQLPACAMGGVAGEAYRNLRAGILLSAHGADSLCLMVTSAEAGEGKTTTSCNLAVSLARAGHRVLLIDGDMRRPRVHDVFGAPLSPGLSELLRGETGFEAARRSEVALNLDVIAAGEPPTNPADLLVSSGLAKLMAWVKSTYTLVVIDAPALMGISDALLLGRHVDTSVLVHRLGSIRRPVFRQLREMLERTGLPVLGVVFNRIDSKDRDLFPGHLQASYSSTDLEPTEPAASERAGGGR